MTAGMHKSCERGELHTQLRWVPSQGTSWPQHATRYQGRQEAASQGGVQGRDKEGGGTLPRRDGLGFLDTRLQGQRGKQPCSEPALWVTYDPPSWLLMLFIL